MTDSPVDNHKNALTDLLVDTWWYGLTRRLSPADFADLARQRVEQGFSAVQLVCGIPPEVGPAHESAASAAGAAWDLDGRFNPGFLELARKRIQVLNDHGLQAIVYGAWGQQIRWLGPEGMAGWWREIIKHLDDLDVLYCLTGESNLWIGREDILLPDRATSDLKGFQPPAWLPGRVRMLGYRAAAYLQSRRGGPDPRLRQQRIKEWSLVLAQTAELTQRPLLIHPNYLETGFQAVENPHLLAANTTQTGHSEAARSQLWQLPLAHFQAYPEAQFINLEPWYEGIRDRFYTADQLYAYWVTMLAGAASYCYGAHGIWNVGDGRFLGQWGAQTFQEARDLATPGLLGQSHAFFLSLPELPAVSYERAGEDLLWIRREGDQGQVTYIPEITRVERPPSGQFWLPLAGQRKNKIPTEGPVVIFQV